jgi:hypothetical protein
MSRRARTRANARPWERPEALSLGPETDDDLEEGDEGEDEVVGDWSSISKQGAALSQIKAAGREQG